MVYEATEMQTVQFALGHTHENDDRGDQPDSHPSCNCVLKGKRKILNWTCHVQVFKT